VLLADAIPACLNITELLYISMNDKYMKPAFEVIYNNAQLKR